MSKKSVLSILVLILFAVVAVASASQKEIASHVESLDPVKDAEEIKAANTAIGVAKIGEFIYQESQR